jgi:DNA-binding XRE family transcriptional regulator
MRKTKRIIKNILEELSQVPNVSIACKKVGISRQTFYRWQKEDEEFKDKVEEYIEIGIESVSDLAESKIVEKIQQGDFKASKYWLDNNKKRYIKPRKPIEYIYHKSDKEIIGNYIQFVDFDKIDDQS